VSFIDVRTPDRCTQSILDVIRSLYYLIYTLTQRTQIC